MKDNNTPQMAAAGKGNLTPQMKQVLETESISPEDLMAGIAAGSIAIPANKNHKNLKAAGVGAGLKTKINVNLGVSKDVCSFEAEMNKARMAVQYQADAIMDLSVAGDTESFRKQLVSEIPVMIGSVPIYDTLTRTGKPTEKITLDDWFDTVEIHGGKRHRFSDHPCGSEYGRGPDREGKSQGLRHCQPGRGHPL